MAIVRDVPLAWNAKRGDGAISGAYSATNAQRGQRGTSLPSGNDSSAKVYATAAIRCSA